MTGQHGRADGVTRTDRAPGDWIAAGHVIRYAQGIEVLPVRTPTLPPATHTNAYLLGTHDLVLVEPASPYGDEVDRIAAWVAARCANGACLRAILLTHHHADHVGGAVALAQRLKAPIWAHAATRDRLVGRVSVQRLLDDRECVTLDGPEPMELTALHTPGHAPGHLCFLESRSGAMLAGDMVASVGTILVEPRDGDMVQYLESLRRMQSLAPRVLLPAHGEAIEVPHARLQAYIEHRLAREQRVVEALQVHGASASAEDLLPIAYGDTPRAAWPLAALSIEAHLLKLQHEGKVRRVAGGWQFAA